MVPSYGGLGTRREPKVGASVVTEASSKGTRSEALALARVKSLGLILSDIQRADASSGLEAVNDLLHVLEVPVIFITAFPERLLSAERPEPAFLISKPYQRTTVSAVISEALFFERNATPRKKQATG